MWRDTRPPASSEKQQTAHVHAEKVGTWLLGWQRRVGELSDQLLRIVVEVGFGRLQLAPPLAAHLAHDRPADPELFGRQVIREEALKFGEAATVVETVR